MEILGRKIGRGPAIAAAGVAAAGLAGYLLMRDSGEKSVNEAPQTTVREPTDQERLDLVMKATSEAADRCKVVMRKGEVAPLRDVETARRILITDVEPAKPSSISMRGEDCAVIAPTDKNSPLLKPGKDGSVEFFPTKVEGFTYTDSLDGDVRERVDAIITWMETWDSTDTEILGGRSSTVNVHLSAGVKPETAFSFNLREFVPKDAECYNPDKPDVPAPAFPQMFGDFSCYPAAERRRKEGEREKEIAAWKKAVVGYRLQTRRRVWGQLVVGAGKSARMNPLQFGAGAMVETMRGVHGKVAEMAGFGSSRRGRR